MSLRDSDKKIDYAIFSAMPEELEFLREKFSLCATRAVKYAEFEFTIIDYNNKKLLLTQTGLGTTFAASIVTLVHLHFNPDCIFFTGTAGGIKEGLAIRDVVIVEKAFEAELQGVFDAVVGTPFATCLNHPLKNTNFPASYSADKNLLNLVNLNEYTDTKVHMGTAVSSNLFPAPQELFERIKSKNASSIDMETSAFYQVAWLYNIPALAIRGISNVLDSSGADENVAQSDLKGSAQAAAQVLLNILNELARSPTLLMQQNKISTETNTQVAKLVNQFKLEAHPEGGFYAQTFKSENKIKPCDSKLYNGEERSAGTSIYYLLKGEDFSAWHSLRSDELWHFYRGSAVIIHLINKEGELKSLLLGDPLNVPGANFQLVIKAGEYFAAEVVDKTSYCFVGCTVTPGFEFRDFHLSDREHLSALYPLHRGIIEKYTREVASSPLKKLVLN